VAGAAIDPIWRKWLPSDPTPAHWYDVARLERLAAAIVAADQESGRQRTVREFIADFRGLSGSAKQKLVLAQSGLSRMLLAELFPDGAADRDRFGRLLAAMQDVTKPVKAADIGIIGKEAIAQRFAEIGARLETFQYKRFIRDDDGIPSVIELAFGYCPSDVDMLQRRIIAGVNWSVSLANPFRQLGGQWGSSLDGYLTEQRIGYDALVAVFIHLACARVNYTDRGKSAVAMDSGAIDILDGLKAVTKIWTKQIKQEERHAAAEDKREERLLRATDRREIGEIGRLGDHGGGLFESLQQRPASGNRAASDVRGAAENPGAHREATRRSIFHAAAIARLHHRARSRVECSL
jgi:hypothetical protein